MSDLIAAAETAVSPWAFWLKLGGIVLLAGSVFAGGVWLGTAIAKPKQLQAQLATAQCETTGEATRANANAAGASGLQNSAAAASDADAQATAGIAKINTGSSKIMETVNAQPNGTALGSNASLRAYLDGLRAAAPAGN